MNSESSKILWATVVVVCVLTVGVADATPIDPAKPTSIETSADAENTAVDTGPFQRLQQSNASTPKTELHVAVHANGSAVWMVRYRFHLDNANETAAFNRLRADIASNPVSYRERFRQRITDAVASAERTTGREMAVETVSVRATRNGTVGIIVYEFVWENFAVTDGNRLRIGDVLTGFYLDNGTRVTISWPDEYEATTVRPAPTERHPNAVVWAGSAIFDGSEPFVELVHSNTTTGGTGSGDERQSGGTTASENELPLLGIGVGVLVFLVGIVGIVWFVRHYQTTDFTAATVASAPEPELQSESEASQETPTEGISTGPNNEPPTAAESDNDDRPSLDLLSNEERVVEVLRRSGGRAKQQQIVETLGWTDAKTSSVVRKLRENGTIEGFRLGRENVLRLTDDGNETETDTDTDTDDTPNNE